MINHESELRVADLFAMLLKAFVPILCTLLILGMLGGAYGAYNVLHKEPSVTEEDLAEAEKTVTKTKNGVKSAERAYKKQNEFDIPDAARKVKNAESVAERRRTYMDNSILQTLDPFHCGVSRITFYIKTDFMVDPDVASLVEDPRNTIAMAYAAGYQNDGDLIAKLRAVMNTTAEEPYILEMVQVKNTSNRFVEILARHSDAAVAEQMANVLFETLEQRMQTTVAPHEANIISTYTGYEINWDLYNSQVTNEDNMISAERSLEDKQNSYETLVDTLEEKEEAITDAKLAYEDAVKKRDSLQKQYDNSVPSKSNILKKAALYGVIGAAGGLVLACIVVLLWNLLNGRLHNQTESKNRYAFPVIGVLPRAKKRLFKKTIGKLEGDSFGSFEAKAQATAQNLLHLIGERPVCLISSLGGAAAEAIVPFTNEKTPICGNILNDAEAIKALDAFEGVILVEQRDKSRIDLIDAEVLRAQSLQKDVVGIVLL